MSSTFCQKPIFFSKKVGYCLIGSSKKWYDDLNRITPNMKQNITHNKRHDLVANWQNSPIVSSEQKGRGGRLVVDPQTEILARFPSFDLSCHVGVGWKGSFPFQSWCWPQCGSIFSVVADFSYTPHKRTVCVCVRWKYRPVWCWACVQVTCHPCHPSFLTKYDVQFGLMEK